MSIRLLAEGWKLAARVVCVAAVKRRAEERWLRTGIPLAPAGHEGAGALLLTPAAASWNGTIVVIIHGGGNDRLFGLSYLFDSLLEGGTAVVTANLPGHGRQGRDEFSLPACRNRVDSLVGEARRIPEVRRVVLLGQSLGAALALDATIRGTDADQVVSVSAPVELHLRTSVLRELTALTRPSIYRALVYGGPLDALPAAGRFKRAEYPVRIPPGLHYLEAFSQVLQEMDLPERLHRRADSSCPVLLVHGGNDGVIPVEQSRCLAEALGERAELQVFDDVTHLDVLYNRRVIGKVVGWIAMG